MQACFQKATQGLRRWSAGLCTRALSMLWCKPAQRAWPQQSNAPTWPQHAPLSRGAALGRPGSRPPAGLSGCAGDQPGSAPGPGACSAAQHPAPPSHLQGGRHPCSRWRWLAGAGWAQDAGCWKRPGRSLALRVAGCRPRGAATAGHWQLLCLGHDEFGHHGSAAESMLQQARIAWLPMGGVYAGVLQGSSSLLAVSSCKDCSCRDVNAWRLLCLWQTAEPTASGDDTPNPPDMTLPQQVSWPAPQSLCCFRVQFKQLWQPIGSPAADSPDVAQVNAHNQRFKLSCQHCNAYNSAGRQGVQAGDHAASGFRS